VIDLFGGLTPFCTKTDFSPSTVHGWMTKGLIPQEYWRWILDCADVQGIAMDYRAFIDQRVIEVD
jgi:hypothetical protein